MYAIDENFYDEIQDIAESIGYEELIEQSDDFTIEAYECDLEIIGFLDGETIAERAFDDDRFSEEDYDDKKKIAKILDANIDFDKINKLLPKLWYPRKKIIITKDELIDSIKHYQ